MKNQGSSKRAKNSDKDTSQNRGSSTQSISPNKIQQRSPNQDYDNEYEQNFSKSRGNSLKQQRQQTHVMTTNDNLDHRSKSVHIGQNNSKVTAAHVKNNQPREVNRNSNLSNEVQESIKSMTQIEEQYFQMMENDKHHAKRAQGEAKSSKSHGKVNAKTKQKLTSAQNSRISPVGAQPIKINLNDVGMSNQIQEEALNSMSSSSRENIKRNNHKASSKKQKASIQDESALLDFLEDEKELSMAQLKNHIRQNHPMKSNDHKWSLMETTGSLVNIKEKRKIPDLLKDIGLGASIYLLTLKAFAFLFVGLSILNIPVLWLYSKGPEAKRLNTGVFTSFMMGNIGESGPICTPIDLSQGQKEFPVVCQSGKIVLLQSFGLTKYNDQNCNEDNYKDYTVWQTLNNDLKAEKDFITRENAWYFKTYMEFHQNCSTYEITRDFRESDFMKGILNQFESKCLNQQQCTISIDVLDLPENCLREVSNRSMTAFNQELFDYLKQNSPYKENSTFVYNRDINRPSPQMFMIAECAADFVKFGGKETDFSKKDAALMVAFFDILTIIIAIFANSIIYYMQKDFVNQYDKQTVESRDFTVVINQIPESFRVCKNEFYLKFSLWTEIQDGIRLSKKMGMAAHNIDTTILDINFGKVDSSLIDHKKQISDMCREIELDYIKFTDDSKPDSKRKALANKMRQDCEKLRIETLEHKRKEKEYKKLQSGFKSDSDDIYDSGESLSSDEDQDLMTDTELHKNKKEKEQFFDSVKLVYITFKSMETKELIESLFCHIEEQKDSLFARQLHKIGIKPRAAGKGLFDMRLRKWKTIMASQNIISQQNKKKKKKDTKDGEESQADGENDGGVTDQLAQFFAGKNEQEMLMVTACDPEFIIWKHIGRTENSRNLWSVLSFISVIMIVVGTYFGIDKFKDWRQEEASNILGELGESGLKGLNCQAYSFTKEQAYLAESENDVLKQQGANKYLTTYKMFCFCQNIFYEDPRKLSDIDFSEFVQQGQPEAQKYCDIWQEQYKEILLLQYIPAALIQVINVLSTFVFIFMAQKNGFYEKGEENQSIFINIFIQEFLCVAVVQIYTEPYQSFDVLWYMVAGYGLCFAMGAAIVSTKASEFGLMIVQLTQRCLDRGCSFKMTKRKGKNSISIKDKANEDSDEKPNTKYLRQSDLEQLYTGPQIESGEKFAQMFVSICVCFMYSLGLPILYPIVAVGMSVSYWFNKVMLMRFYQRTYEFNETLPLQSMQTMKVAFIAHFAVGAVKLYMGRPILKQTHGTSQTHMEVHSNFNDFEEDAKTETHLLLYNLFMSFVIFLFFIDYAIYPFWDSFIESIVKFVSQKPKSKDDEQHVQIIANSTDVSPGKKTDIQIQEIDKKDRALIEAKQRKELNRKRQELVEKNGQLGENINQNSDNDSNASLDLSDEEDLQEILKSNPELKKKVRPKTDGSKEHKIGAEAQDSDRRKSLILAEMKQKKVLTEDQIDDAIENVGPVISSDNYYEEVLFDYLEIFYKKVLIDQADTREYLYNLEKKVEKGTMNLESMKQFKKYYKSIVNRRNLIEKQIDFYYLRTAEIELAKKKKQILENQKAQGSTDTHAHVAGPVSGSNVSGFVESQNLTLSDVLPPINELDFISKISYLDTKYDEQELQQKYFPNNFRCKSFIQSYNQYDSEEYAKVDTALKRAEILHKFIMIDDQNKQS